MEVVVVAVVAVIVVAVAVVVVAAETLGAVALLTETPESSVKVLD